MAADGRMRRRAVFGDDALPGANGAAGASSDEEGSDEEEEEEGSSDEEDEQGADGDWQLAQRQQRGAASAGSDSEDQSEDEEEAEEEEEEEGEGAYSVGDELVLSPVVQRALAGALPAGAVVALLGMSSRTAQVRDTYSRVVCSCL